MKFVSADACMKACLLAAVFLVVSGFVYPDDQYGCNNDCRERQYFWENSGSYGIAFQTASCLYCVTYRCYNDAPPKYYDCKPGDIQQYYQVVDTSPTCSYSGTDAVEANPQAPTGKWLNFFQKVYTCQ